jgi:hypothetical protein
LKSGKGKYFVRNNLMYEGDFQEGTIHGRGKYIDEIGD